MTGNGPVDTLLLIAAAILDSGTGSIFTMGGGTTNPGDNLT